MMIVLFAYFEVFTLTYSKPCVKRPLSKRPKIGFQDQLSLNAGQKYCRMLQGEHSAILSTFIKLPFVIKIFVLSIFEWCFYCTVKPVLSGHSKRSPKIVVQERLSLRAIPEKNTWGGEGGGGGGGGGDGRRYIFLWVVGAESFQIIWVIGVRPNLITWVVGISMRGRGRKNIICQKKREVLSNLAKRKCRAKQTAAERAIFVYTQSSKLECFRRILVKNAAKINSPTVASVAVITSLGKHVFSEEFIQGNNAIG